MNKGRLEAFSDGVIAILITIMVLELKPPQGGDLASLGLFLPQFLVYALSYIFLGIYWSNHHHLLQAVQKVNGAILWANLHLLFWLSLVPFGTAWLGREGLMSLPVGLYGVDLLLAAVAYYILVRALIAHHGKNSTLAKAIGDDIKGKISLVFYALAIPAAWFLPWVSYGIYILVAVLWLVPDRRIEEVLKEKD